MNDELDSDEGWVLRVLDADRQVRRAVFGASLTAVSTAHRHLREGALKVHIMPAHGESVGSGTITAGGVGAVRVAGAPPPAVPPPGVIDDLAGVIASSLAASGRLLGPATASTCRDVARVAYDKISAGGGPPGERGVDLSVVTAPPVDGTPVSRTGVPPKYVQIVDDLRGKIERGDLAEGAEISSERALADTWRVARMTAVKALDILAREGWIVRVHGRGSYVARKRSILFRREQRKLHSGAETDWIIDCRALGHEDLRCLAHLAHRLIGPWGDVEGVPNGGLAFADVCRELSTDGPLLIADDVCTTGTSLEEQRAGRNALGIVMFARGLVPRWAVALFSLAAEDEP